MLDAARTRLTLLGMSDAEIARIENTGEVRRLVTIAAGLRARGVRVDLSYGGRGLKGAMKSADRSGARFALVLGERDIDAGSIGLKDLVSGEQQDVPLDAVLDAVVTAVAAEVG